MEFRVMDEIADLAGHGLALLINEGDGSALTVDGAAPTISIGARDANNNATVQVDHAFTPLLAQSGSQGGTDAFSLPGLNNLTLSAKVVTALPADN